jgi:hypothetical protein
MVACLSIKGAPGATTAALAVTATWPPQPPAVLVEADPAGGDLAARFRLAGWPGLVSLAAALRHDPNPHVLATHTQPVLGGRAAVVAGAWGAQQAQAAVSVLAPAGPAWAASTEPVVIVDCGRWDAGSPSLALAQAADVVLIVARPRADELAQLAARLPATGRWRGMPGLVLAGQGYSPSQIRAALRIPIMAVLPHDPRSAALLRGDGTWYPGAHRRPLLRAAAGLAGMLHANATAPTPSVESDAGDSRAS